MTAEKAKLRAVLVANKSYGLYICETAMTTRRRKLSVRV